MKTMKNTNSKDFAANQSFILNASTGFATREMFNRIQTEILFSLPKKEKGQAILVTSPCANEGSTAVLVNTAITFAKMNYKVCIVDFDMRIPAVQTLLGCNESKGMNDVLVNDAKLEDVIQKEIRKNLDIIIASECHEDPTELLGSHKCTEMMETLKEKYDYVFINCPPVMAVTDAVIMTKKCEGVIVVIRKDYTDAKALDETIITIQKTGTPLLGIISNEMASKRKIFKKNNEYIKK